MDKLLYGAAYYDEYMPMERLEKDIELMKKANVNVVRIAESTWSTVERQDGVFDFTHIDRVVDAMEANGIFVIIGTPTYAVPTWLVKKFPEILAVTRNGQGKYGTRQNMDITNKDFLFYAERVIRKIMERYAKRKCVIGFQLDNETKYYDTAGKNVQSMFVEYLKEKFTLEEMNKRFGLDYWSNRINSWEDFPDVTGTINGSLGGEFDKFRRTLVDKYLAWQSDIVKEYKRDDQFITHNFDYEWRGHSFGVQPDVNHFKASKAVSIAGCDIYHRSKDELTGIEIAFGGDISRSLKSDNYFVLETLAQGFPEWLPYENQLRLQAFSHLSSGADAVMYWHWHTLHNACETYWRGILGQDFTENASYQEIATIGRDFKKLNDKLIHLKKNNKVAIVVSNESLTAMYWFALSGCQWGGYNDVVRYVYDALYKMNVECDFITTEDKDKLQNYDLVVVPCLYAVERTFLSALDEYVFNGGNIFVTFKSGFCDEYVKVTCDIKPTVLSKACGVSYSQFTVPKDVTVKGKASYNAETFMELLIPSTATTLYTYDHYAYKKYSAATLNKYGKGSAVYMGCMAGEDFVKDLLSISLKESGLWGKTQELSFPVIVRSGVNQFGKKITYVFNYSDKEVKVSNVFGDAEMLLEEKQIKEKEEITLAPWGFVILEIK